VTPAASRANTTALAAALSGGASAMILGSPAVTTAATPVLGYRRRHHSMQCLLVLFLTQIATRSALVICSQPRVIFYHIPKTAGSSVELILQRITSHTAAHNHTNACDIAPTGSVAPRRVAEHWGRAHASPRTLEEFVRREVDFKDVTRTMASVDFDAVRRYRSFTVVRCPYTRLLSSFDHRFGRARSYYPHWPCSERSPCGSLPPKGSNATTFAGFVAWLEAEITSGKRAWCCSPPLIHFVPATQYTHW
jgi:hypothetical protein